MFFDFIISVQFLPIVPRFQKPCLKPKKINFLLYVSESRKIVLKEIWVLKSELKEFVSTVAMSLKLGLLLQSTVAITVQNAHIRWGFETVKLKRVTLKLKYLVSYPNKLLNQKNFWPLEILQPYWIHQDKLFTVSLNLEKLRQWIWASVKLLLSGLRSINYFDSFNITVCG